MLACLPAFRILPMRRDHATFGRAGALVLAVAILGGCGAGGGDAVAVDLGVLVDQAAEFTGRTVRTSGHLRHHPDPAHDWIENPELQRVGLTGEPVAGVPVGRMVEVTGQFRYAPERGRWLEVTTIRVVD
jgi:hypothetical protein